MFKQSGFALGLVSAGVAGLGLVLGGGYVAKKLKDSIDTVSTRVDQRMGEAIRAVPGERLLQMYDGLFGADEKKRKEVKDVLARMLNADPTKSYVTVASMGFDVTKKPLRAQLFTAPSNSISEVHAVFQPNGKEDLKSIKGEIRRGLTKGEFRTQVGDAFLAAANLDVTDADIEKLWGRKISNAERIQFHPICWGAAGCLPNPSAEFQKQAIEVRKDRWINAVMMLMDDATKPIPGDQLSVPWRPLNGDQFLFIAMRADDLKEHLEDPCTNKAQGKSKDLKGCIRVWVREIEGKGDPIPGTSAMDISLEEFTSVSNPAVPNPLPSQGDIVWVARDLNTGSALDANTLSAMRARRGLLHTLDEEAKAAKPAGGT